MPDAVIAPRASITAAAPATTAQKIDAVFDAVLSAVRNTLDPDAVTNLVGELAAEHGIVAVNAALEAVEVRLETERRIVAALRAIPPWPVPNEQHGHA